MRELKVYIEIEGNSVMAGSIVGNNSEDACFSYAKDYIDSAYPPISISLPIQKNEFTKDQTKNFFEGLLPEGFTKRTVAGWLHVDENDYVSILSELGKECIGAIRINEEGNNEAKEGQYQLLEMEQVKALAKEGATKSAEIVTKSHLSLTGASGKVGLMYDEGEWYQPLYDAPSTHIVKQSHVRLDGIVINEMLALETAKRMGIEVADNFIIDVGVGKDEDILFASKRFDRLFDESCTMIGDIKRPLRLHQEDFAQAMGIGSKDKYEHIGQHYMAEMFSVLRNYSANPLQDGLKLWDLTIFDFLIGNTDNHIKNRSLLYSPSLSQIRLAPAYDIVSTTIYPTSTRNMAYSIGGKISIDDINRQSFAEAAKECGLGSGIALNHFDEMVEKFNKALDDATEHLSSQKLEKAEEIRKRILETCGYTRIV